ncbi:hypothetical protein [Caballeronia sp. S22]|uniref:hypothetical protein n=1 Tax=Caballeronia sp. S22 TaxID=3137182 RepID=UPI0035308394
MSVADLAYVQQILDETFDDIWTSPREYQFDVKRNVPAWALEAWPWPRAADLADDFDADESGDDCLSVDEHGCRFSVSPVLLSYNGELD